MFTKVFAAALFTLGIKSAQAGLDAELKLCLGLDCGFCVTEEVPFNSCLNVFDFAGIMLRCTDDGEEIDVDLMSSSDCSGSLIFQERFPLNQCHNIDYQGTDFSFNVDRCYNVSSKPMVLKKLQKLSKKH